jgi:hypothetical protein
MQDDKDNELSKKRRDDKIFNNGYRTGEAMRDEEYQYQTSISVNQNYADAYLKDVYEYEETLEYNAGISKIFELIEDDPDLSALLYKKSHDTKIKLSKEEINWCFNQILNKLKKISVKNQFYSPIYIVEALSSILNVNSGDPIKDYKKLFDALDAELQEELVVELDKKYGILNGRMSKKRIH